MMYLLIALGSALGGMARFWCSEAITPNMDSPIPWDTIIVNVVGSFIIGFFAAMTGPDGKVSATPEIRQFVMIGICGGYTTFSSFSLQTLHLFHEGEFFHAGANIILSVILCLVFVWLGYILATFVNQLPKTF